jgi:hypothetical protein
MVFELNLIPVKLMQEEVLVDLLRSYHAAHGIFFLHFLTEISDPMANGVLISNQNLIALFSP